LKKLLLTFLKTMLRVAILLWLFVISAAPTLSESETVEASEQTVEASEPTKPKYFFPDGRDKRKYKKSYSLRRSQRSVEEELLKMNSPERMSEHVQRFIKSRLGDINEKSSSEEKPKIWTREEHRAYLDGIKAEHLRETEEYRARLEEKERKRWEWKQNFAARRDPRAEYNKLMDRAKLPTFDIRDSKDNIIRLDPDNFPDGRVFLIVNTASECDFSHQYAGLEELYQEFKDQGLRVVAFPSDSFNKEPATNEYIQSFVKERYKVTFPVMGKCEVNGPNQHELFTYLKTISTRRPKVPDWAPLEQTNLWEKDIQWNFEKFLIWKINDIERVTRFHYDVAPMHMAKDVRRVLRRLDILSEGMGGRKMEL